jgi:hypothetical protein
VREGLAWEVSLDNKYYRTHTHTHTQFIPPGGPNPKGQLSYNLLIHILKWILIS